MPITSHAGSSIQLDQMTPSLDPPPRMAFRLKTIAFPCRSVSKQFIVKMEEVAVVKLKACSEESVLQAKAEGTNGILHGAPRRAHKSGRRAEEGESLVSQIAALLNSADTDHDCIEAVELTCDAAGQHQRIIVLFCVALL